MAVPLDSTPTAGSYSNYAPGQVGGSINLNDKTYTIVQVKAGDTVAVNQVLYWYDKTQAIVTSAVASSNRNQVAGIARVAVAGADNPNGTLIAMLVKGHAISVKDSGTAIAAANVAIASATSGEIDGVAAGTAPGYTAIGIITGADAAGICPVDVDLDTPL